jgi:hypothetical protein
LLFPSSIYLGSLWYRFNETRRKDEVNELTTVPPEPPIRVSVHSEEKAPGLPRSDQSVVAWAAYLRQTAQVPEEIMAEGQEDEAVDEQKNQEVEELKQAEHPSSQTSFSSFFAEPLSNVESKPVAITKDLVRRRIVYKFIDHWDEGVITKVYAKPKAPHWYNVECKYPSGGRFLRYDQCLELSLYPDPLPQTKADLDVAPVSTWLLPKSKVEQVML